MARHVLDLEAVDATMAELVGGKGANLGELARVEGVRVPPGFCVTTHAFEAVTARDPAVTGLLEELAVAEPTDAEAIRRLGAAIRDAVATAPVPTEVVDAVSAAVVGLGDDVACAVRSSATAEDLPAASAAGQHDSHLGLVGVEPVLDAVRRCWASLFTDRAIAYRRHAGIDHRAVQMAVVVQRVVPAIASGVLFTAEPLTGDRRTSAVEAVPGLGDALVAGLVDPDAYRVRRGEIVEREPAAAEAVLADEHLLELEALGRKVEAHLGAPQDIEWCLAPGGIHVVQARPITTLFPVPDDGGVEEATRVYVSVGHQQMMTDPMTPLGLSVWQLTSPAPVRTAGGRLFVDVTARLTSPATRAGLLEAMGRSDPLTRDALETVVALGDVPLEADDGAAPALPWTPPEPIDADPTIVAELVARNEASVDALASEVRTRSGTALFDLLLEDIQELRRLLFDPRSSQVFLSAMEAAHWLDEHLCEWLGERGAADVLTQSVPFNVTSEMGLALLDVADAIRPHGDVVALLRSAGDDDGFLDRLDDVEGGPGARAAIEAYLDRYGMRCVGEIDIARPRWRDRPSALLPVILADVDAFEPGESARRFERGRQEALAKAEDVLTRLRAMPDGEARAAEVERRIDLVRTFIGYREYPKYGMVRRYGIYRDAILAEAERMVEAGVLRHRDDSSFLTFQELHDVARTGHADLDLVDRRRDAFRWYATLTPPRILTSHGHALSGSYRRDDVPAGALPGLAVSAGTVEGRARVVLDVADAALEPGDVLVTTHTDPSWSPLFVLAAGLVTEVGGLMTHGAVVAREYGLPAVVGVAGATQRIPDGATIRVDGTAGYVEVLAGPADPPRRL